MPTTMMIEGTTQTVMNVNFHCTIKAITNAEMKVDKAWTMRLNFSEMPLFTLLPLVVACVVTDVMESVSKYAMF